MARGGLDADHAPEGLRELLDVVGGAKHRVPLLLLPPAAWPRLRELVHVKRVLDARLLHEPLQFVHVVHAVRILEVRGETRRTAAAAKNHITNDVLVARPKGTRRRQLFFFLRESQS